MSGPKSPHGYSKIFHNILADIYVNRPEQIKVKSAKAPAHMRALFNQFRASWERQAVIHRKQKDVQQEMICRENYRKLLEYTCTLDKDGIVLTHKDVTSDTYELHGRVKPEETYEIDHGATIQELHAPAVSDEALLKMFGHKPKPAPVIPDNPPELPPSNKYGIPLDPPPGFLDKK